MFTLLFTFMSFQDLEALAKTDHKSLHDVRRYIEDNWIRFLPQLPTHTSILNQLHSNQILIHHSNVNGLLITGCLNTGTSLITFHSISTIVDERVIGAHLDSKGDCIFLEASNDLFTLKEECTLLQSQVKLIDEFAYLQCDGWLTTPRYLYKPPNAGKITCIAFPWLGYEDGLILNVQTQRLLNTHSSILCLAISKDLVISGHANGTISINATPVRITRSPISALHIAFGVILVGSADGVLHCLCNNGTVQWSTRQLDKSPIMQINTEERCITVSTFSRIFKIYSPPSTLVYRNNKYSI